MRYVACKTLCSNQFKSEKRSTRDGYRVVNPRVSHRVYDQIFKSRYGLTVKYLAGYKHLSTSVLRHDRKWLSA